MRRWLRHIWPARGKVSPALPMACPWCHTRASVDLQRGTEGLGASERVTCPSCDKASPLSFWHVEGEVVDLAEASEEVVAELDKLSPKHRERIETRLRRESEALEMSVTGEERRAKEFLDTWVAAHVHPDDGDFDEQVSRLLQKFVVDAVQADIPGPALFRLAGGDLVVFMTDALRQSIRPSDGSPD